MRNVGSDHWNDVGLREAIDEGKIVGPRIVPAAYAIGSTGGHCDSTYFPPSMAQKSPYVEMFVWFILRDSSDKTWFSGLIQKGGKKKPAFNIFKASAKTIDGQTLQINPHAASFTVKVDVQIPPG